MGLELLDVADEICSYPEVIDCLQRVKDDNFLAGLEKFDGGQKVKETKQRIDLIRNFSGFREYPKYGMINRYFVNKKALLKEAGKLVQAGVIHEKEDIYYITLGEIGEVVRTNKPDYQIVSKQKDE